MPNTLALSQSATGKRMGWSLFLVALSLVFSLALACAVPLAAFAAIAAATLSRREALYTAFSVWLANQIVGFTCLHYPIDATTFAWGAVLGVITIACCETAGALCRHLPGAMGLAAAFLASFFVYEGTLLIIDIALGLGTAAFTVAIVTRIFLINFCAFGSLVALRFLGAVTIHKPQKAIADNRA